MVEKAEAPQRCRMSLLILVLFSVAQILWMVGEFGAERRALLEREALDPGRELITLLRHEAESAQRNLAIVQSQAEVVLKEHVRERVDEAVGIAEAIYAQAAGTMSDQALRALIRESLRSPRFFNRRGYYFIDDMDGNCVLLPTVPRLEGTSLIDNRDDAGRYIMRELIHAVSGPGDAGYVRYSWYPPNVTNGMDDKVAYARQFKPFNWLIGTGDYISKVEDSLKAEALERLRSVRLTRGGRLVVLDKDGVVRLFPDSPILEGEKIDHLADGPETTILKTIWRAAHDDGSGAARFTMAASDTGRPQTWFVWAQTEPTFNWVVAAMAAGDDAPVERANIAWRWGLRFGIPIALLVAAALWALFAGVIRERDRS